MMMLSIRIKRVFLLRVSTKLQVVTSLKLFLRF